MSLPVSTAWNWHAGLDMSVRMRVAIVGVGVLAVACSAAPTPSEPVTPPSRTLAPSEEPATTPAPDPGVSYLRVTPEEGRANATVTLDVACLDTLGPVRSPVLDIGALQADPAGHQPWRQTGTATVRSDATPGEYEISATCGTETLLAVFTVEPHH